LKSTVTHGCVLKSGRIESESVRTNCGVSTGSVVEESIHSHGCIFTPGIVSESKRADSGIEATFRVDIQSECSVGRVFSAGGVAKERLRTTGHVEGTAGVVEKGVRTQGSVFAARGIVKKGGRSDSRVVGAGRVEQKRRRANGRVFDSLARSLVSNVEKKRPGTESGVKAAIGVAEERKPPNRCVSYAGSEAFKGISPFCRVEARIASVRGWTDCMCVWQGRKIEDYDCDEKQWTYFFHRHEVSAKSRQRVEIKKAAREFGLTADYADSTDDLFFLLLNLRHPRFLVPCVCVFYL